MTRSDSSPNDGPNSTPGRSDPKRGGQHPAPGAEPALVPGDSVSSRYRLERQISEDGLGELWMAWDSTVEEFVSLKFLPPGMSQDPEALHDLKVEAKRLLGLSHPSIVRLRDMGFEGMQTFLVQEHMAGGSLADFVVGISEGTLSLDETMWALRQVAPALEHGHAQGLTHGDIKPGSLFLSQTPGEYLGNAGENLLIADFGLSTAVHKATAKSGAQLSSAAMAFMAPEILLGGQASPAADVYSLAATVYFLMVGEAPFNAREQAKRTLDAPSLELLSGRASLDRAVALGLSRDPAKRPGSVIEFMQLAEGLQSLGAAEVAPRTRRKLPQVVAVGAVLVAASFLAKGVWFPAAEGRSGAEAEHGNSLLAAAKRGQVEEVKQMPEPIETAQLATALEPQTPELADPLPVLTTSKPEPPVEVEEPAPVVATFQQEVLAATSLAELTMVMQTVSVDADEQACRELCGAAIPRVRELLEQEGSGEAADAEAAVATLTLLETAGGLSRCGNQAEWKQLASAHFSMASLLVIEGAAPHGEASHDCYLAEDLADLRDEALASSLELVKQALAQPGLGFLESAEAYESLGGILPDSLLTDCLARLKELPIAGPREQTESHIKQLVTYQLGREEIPLAVQARAAIQMQVQSLVDLTLAPGKKIKFDQMFADFAALERLLASTKFDGPLSFGDLYKRLGKRFPGAKRSTGLIKLSYQFLTDQKPSFLKEEIYGIIAGACEALSKGLPKAKLTNYSLKDMTELLGGVDECRDLEASYAHLKLGEPGAPISIYEARRSAVQLRIKTVLAFARKAMLHEKVSRWSRGSKALFILGKAMAASPSHKAEYIELLPEIVGAQAQEAESLNRDWVNEGDDDTMFDTKGLDRAIETAKDWLAVAKRRSPKERSYQSLAFIAVLEAELTTAERYADLCERHVFHFGGGDGNKITVPWPKVKKGKKFLRAAESHCTEFEQFDRSAAQASKLRRRLSRVAGRLGQWD